MTSFAVVIPLYNKGPHITRTIDSVLRQSYPPAEIFVVDDASTDDGLERAQWYRDDRLKFLRRTTPGPGGYAARNLAILSAQSEWIAFLDADDEWSPGHLGSLHQAILATNGQEQEPVIGVFAGYTNRYRDGEMSLDRFTKAKGRGALNTFGFQELLSTWIELRECPIWTSASAFRRKALVDAGLFPHGRCSRGGDKDLWLRVARNGRVAAAPAVTAIYHRDSMNMVTKVRSTDMRHCICETINQMLPQVDEASRRLLRQLFNQEVYQYAVQAAKVRKVNPASWRGFFIQENPMRFIVLTGLSTAVGAFAARLLRGCQNYVSRAPQ